VDSKMVDLAPLPADNDQERMRRLLAISGGMSAGPVTRPATPVSPAAPALERLSPVVSDALPPSDATRLKPIGFKERQALPLTSPGAPAGSAASYQNKLERIEDQKANPWGSPENHPGFGGKLAHIAAKVGNIAGDVLAPAVMANIPGTDLHRQAEERQTEKQLGEAQTRETAAAGEKIKEREAATGEEKEASEEPLREAQAKHLNEADSATLAEHGLRRDETGNVVADPTSPAYQKQQLAGQAVQNLMALRSAQADLAQAREEVERAKNDPNSPAFKVAQQKLAMAQYAHDIAMQNLGLHQAQFQNKLQEQELVKPSGQAQSRGSAAQAALDVLPELEQQIRTNAAELGPIFGRLAKGEIAIGNVDPKIAKLYSSLTSFYALNPAIHGFRNFEFVKDMPSFIGGLERDPEATIAGLEGLRPTLESVMKEGKTSHKRIVEGRDTNTPAGGGAPQPPKAGDVVKGYRFKGGEPSDKNNWEKAS
jgi:hypothetical protein